VTAWRLRDDPGVQDLAALITEAHGRWLSKAVVDVLGTDDPGSVADAVVRSVEQALGAPVVGARFYEAGVGVVTGLVLADDRSVVAKLHRASYVARERLEAVVEVQSRCAASLWSVPAPLAGPVAVGNGWLTIEELRHGATADGVDAAVRAGMAAALHDLVVAAAPCAVDERLDGWLGSPVIGELWPEPHDLRFDLAGTSSGAEWIDDAARAARAVLTSTELPVVVGHFDWRVQNLAFDGSRVAAIYDWDSIHLGPEAAVVGSASVIHPVDWRRDLADPLPSPAQVEAFVRDYEVARGTPFAGAELAVLRAAQRWTASYGARCQHSDQQLDVFPDVDHSHGWPRLLRELLAP